MTLLIPSFACTRQMFSSLFVMSPAAARVLNECDRTRSMEIMPATSDSCFPPTFVYRALQPAYHSITYMHVRRLNDYVAFRRNRELQPLDRFVFTYWVCLPNSFLRLLSYSSLACCSFALLPPGHAPFHRRRENKLNSSKFTFRYFFTVFVILYSHLSICFFLSFLTPM